MLVIDPPLVNRFYKKIQKASQKGSFTEEIGKIPNDIVAILGVDPIKYDLRTFQDSWWTYAQKFENYLHRRSRRGVVEEMSINPFSFILPKDSPKKPILLHIGNYMQEFQAIGKRFTPMDPYAYAYGEQFLNIPTETYGLRPAVDFDKVIKPVTGEIDNLPGVIRWTSKHEKAEIVDAFLEKNPDLFTNNQIRKWYC
jgi:hypothetical protein